MLQQTQVATVIDYYLRFMARFPDVSTLASASLDEVLAMWAGLGYYSRARNLHACAVSIMTNWRGKFPTESRQLQTLPGIGRSTAAAIAAFCFGERAAILDGNVRRVFCRYFGIAGDPGQASTQKTLWEVAEKALPDDRQLTREPDSMQRYTQGLMDLGATLCTRSQPRCPQCPLRAGCIALKQGRVSELPAARARRLRPERELHLMVITHGRRILLARRPAKGVWASLWSLPQSDEEQDLLAGWQALIAQSKNKPQRMASLTHDLTHFRMILKPWHLDLDPTIGHEQLISDETTVWADHGNIHQFGMPKPIRDLVESFIRP